MKTNKKLEFIHIYYRHVPSSRQINKLRPEWFTYESAFLNLIHSIKCSPPDVKVRMTILFDGDENSLKLDFINKYIDEVQAVGNDIPISIKLIKGGSAFGAWKLTVEHIKKNKFNSGELLYILENDYIHTPNWISEVANLYASEIPYSYISLYDHSDKYPFHSNSNAQYRKLCSSLFVTSTCHWRTTPSSCASFLVRPDVFVKDLYIWTSGLTDRRIFPLLRLLKDRVLLTPIPGLSTHCMSAYMSPCVNWENHSKSNHAAEDLSISLSCR